MKKSMEINQKMEMGLIVRDKNIFSRMKRFWNIVCYKEELNFLQKIEKYVLKNKPKGKIIIPETINKEIKLNKKDKVV